jgi:hypothetical protein
MKEFEAQKLVNSIRCLIGQANLVQEIGAYPARKDLIRIAKEQTLALLECCKAADLKMSVLAINRILSLFRNDLTEDVVARSIVDAVWRVIIAVEDEMSLRIYFSLEPSEAEIYANPWREWEKVVERFGDTVRDIEEMNKCFAFGRYTASMFHALHVAEWGAIELGNYIGVTDPKRGWGPTEKKLRELVKAGHQNLPAFLAGKFSFIEQMSREIDSMVLAWRHKVDHAANHLAIVPNAEFTPDIAKHIIGAVS